MPPTSIASRRRSWRALAAAAALALAGAGEPARFHVDPAAVQTAALEVARAVFLDEMTAARKALDRLEKQCERLMPEQRQQYGETIVDADRAYHLALSRAREYSGAGESDMAFEAFVGVQKVCRTCHKLARAEGRWPGGAVEP